MVVNVSRDANSVDGGVGQQIAIVSITALNTQSIRNFGKSLGPATRVPEPGTLALLTPAALLAPRLRR